MVAIHMVSRYQREQPPASRNKICGTRERIGGKVSMSTFKRQGAVRVLYRTKHVQALVFSLSESPIVR